MGEAFGPAWERIIEIYLEDLLPILLCVFEKEIRWADLDFYGLLELTPSASLSEIKKNYRRVALIHHPDKAAPEDNEKATQNFQLIAEASQVLSDPEKRQRYDNVRQIRRVWKDSATFGSLAAVPAKDLAALVVSAAYFVRTYSPASSSLSSYWKFVRAVAAFYASLAQVVISCSGMIDFVLDTFRIGSIGMPRRLTA